MIYLFAGDDVKKKHAAYIKFMKSEPKGTETFLISRNEFNKSQIESFYSGSGLFFSRCAVVFSSILEREENRDFILEKLKLMTESENDFIFLESKLNKPVLDAFKKSKAVVEVFELTKLKVEKFNS